MGERKIHEKGMGPGETHGPPALGVREFLGSPEFRRFRVGMKKLLTVRKSDLDRMVSAAKERSPRTGNPNAPGRKPRRADG
jgi:hypothetical protein